MNSRARIIFMIKRTAPIMLNNSSLQQLLLLQSCRSRSLRKLHSFQCHFSTSPKSEPNSSYSEGKPSSQNKRKQQKLLDKIIRVDHAGEFAAVQIYAGQYAVLGRSAVGPKLKEMWDEEKVHFSKFEELIPEHRVRPTALLPIWRIAGYALGAGTALMGKEAAMACTVAVETTIGEHYNNQLRELVEDDPEGHTELLKVIKQFRDEELEHLDTGLEHGAEQAPFYKTLSQVIQVGCKGAVWLSERI